MIQGTWIPTQAELAGTPWSEDVLKSMKLLIGEHQYKVFMGNQVDHGTLTIDKTARPKTMELIGDKGPNKDKTILAIFEVVGDNLTICYDLDGVSYPADFATQPGTRLFLVNYARVP